MCSLIENGQHFAVYVYPCEIFPNSEIAQKAYREKYRIGSTRSGVSTIRVCQKSPLRKLRRSQLSPRRRSFP